jgi:hypothetical protein
MITKFQIFKLYEKPKKSTLIENHIYKHEEPQVGDWVIAQDKYDFGLNDILSNHIGQIITNDKKKISKLGWDSQINYIVKYNPSILHAIDKENLEEEEDLLTNYTRGFSRNEIIHFSPDKEYLEAMIAAKKYNL